MFKANNPQIYNGDLKTLDDYSRLSERFPSVKGWMIGRGLLMNPFLAMEIKSGKPESETVRIERIKQFADYLLDAYIHDLQSPAHVLDKMRGLWFYLSHAFPDSRKIEKKIRKAGNLNHYRDEVGRIFDIAVLQAEIK